MKLEKSDPKNLYEFFKIFIENRYDFLTQFNRLSHKQQNFRFTKKSSFIKKKIAKKASFVPDFLKIQGFSRLSSFVLMVTVTGTKILSFVPI